MSKTTAPIGDAVARQRLENDLDTNFLVEAGAGSGKTYGLVQRITNLIKQGRARAEQIAAITFTRKAAAEIRQRLQSHLEEAWRSESDAGRKELLRQASEDIGQLFVGTIHSFCGRLLRQFPFEVGFDPMFIEIEDAEYERLDRALWLEYLALQQERGVDLGGVLADLGLDQEDLYEAFRALSLHPDTEPAPGSGLQPDHQEVHQRLGAALSSLRQRFPSTMPKRGWDRLQRGVLQARRYLRLYEDGLEPRYLRWACEAVNISPSQVTLNRWATKDAGTEARDIISAFREDVIAPYLQSWREYTHAQILELVKPAVSFVADRRRQMGRASYQDLLIGAAKLLREFPKAREQLAATYTHLLVDEFQDTDPVQAEVVFLLNGLPYNEQDWLKVDLRPGGLFLVGDPKQSIYRFRRADITTYHAVQKRLVETGGEVLHLTTSFRAVPEITQPLNDVFKDQFPASATAIQAAYAPLISVRPASQFNAGVMKLTVPKAPNNAQHLIVKENAQRIAAWIAWACQGNLLLDRSNGETSLGAKPQDFLVITPNRNHLLIYAAALEDAGVPVDISGAKLMRDAPELQLFLTVLDAIADPVNPVKTLACLRSEAFGLSDDALYRYHKAGGQIRLDIAPPDADTGDVADALRKLRALRQYAEQLPPAALAELAAEQLGLIAYSATATGGGQKSGAIITALDLLREIRHTTLAQAIADLRTSLTLGDLETFNISSSGQAVRVMNLHKAKGLEAPVVILADPSRKTSYPPNIHIERDRNGSKMSFCIRSRASFYGSGKVISSPLDWDDAQAREAGFLAAEHTRLLYVAATRAKNLLVVSRYEGKPEDSFWSGLEPMLKNALEVKLPQQAPAAAPAKRIRRKSLMPSSVDAARAKLQAAAATNWQLTSPSAMTAKNFVPPMPEDGQNSEEPSGMAWGRVVHEMLARIAMYRPDVEEWTTIAASLLSSEGLDCEPDVLVAAVTRVWDEIGGRVLNADQVLCEMPFAFADGDRQITGTIDLAFKEPDGWVLVDYKTDPVTPDRLKPLIERYSPQIEAYGEAWAHLAPGEKVKEKLLLFTSPSVVLAEV